MNAVLMGKEDLIQAMIAQDHQQRFLPEQYRKEYGEYAWDKGMQAAKRCIALFPGLEPEQMVQRMGLTVLDEDGPGYYFSEYNVNKKQIVLFRNVICVRFLEPEQEHLRVKDYDAIRPLFLAHELFHHLECSDPEIGVTYRERKVTVFILGPFRWQTGLRCLSEIAAHSFAKQMVGERLILSSDRA